MPKTTLRYRVINTREPPLSDCRWLFGGNVPCMARACKGSGALRQLEIMIMSADSVRIRGACQCPNARRPGHNADLREDQILFVSSSLAAGESAAGCVFYENELRAEDLQACGLSEQCTATCRRVPSAAAGAQSLRYLFGCSLLSTVCVLGGVSILRARTADLVVE